MRKIAVINQKGGVGKTTTALNVGASLASRGRGVLLVDLDPQAHLTLGLGIELGPDDFGSYDVLIDARPITQAIVEARPSLYLVGSGIDLAAAETELASRDAREVILRDMLVRHREQYDFVFFDCPPSLGLLTLNGLAAADEVMITLQPHFLALQGVGRLLETVRLVATRINPRLTVCGVAICMNEPGTKLAGEVKQDMQTFLKESEGKDLPWSGARVFEATVRRNIKLAECPSHGQSIFEYAASSHGAVDYQALADELAATRPRTPPPGKTAPAHSKPAQVGGAS